MVLRTDQFDKCLLTLEGALHQLGSHNQGTLEYDILLSAVIKNYELAVETAGKLVRKALKPYFGEPLHVARLHYADVFREAVRFGLLDVEWVHRWLGYRNSRNRTAHDYGADFAEALLPLMPAFLADCRELADRLVLVFGSDE